MVEVFKTNVACKDEADKVVQQLQEYLPAAKINFDLYDCDKILRVECGDVPVPQITRLFTAMGLYCEVLE